MKAGILATSNPSVILVEPNIERDSALGVEWINGPMGRETLKLMGVTDKDNQPTTLQLEQERVQEFITGKNQLNWMISYKDKVIGAIWVVLQNSEYLKSPSIHIMLGNVNVRGQGIGTSAVESILKYLKLQGYNLVYSRYLLINAGSKKLLNNFGFEKDGESYSDADGLEWQNVTLNIA